MREPAIADFHGLACQNGHGARDDTGRHFVRGAAPATRRTARVYAAAGWCWQEGEAGICARRPPLLWDTNTQKWRRWNDNGTSLLRALIAGDLIVASDDLVILWTADTLRIRSSASGGSVVYYEETESGVVFAQAIPLLARARDAALDLTGLAEIARFGANCAQRTLLQGIRRLPIGHELVVEEQALLVRSYTDFSSQPPITDPDEASALIRSRLTDLAGVLPERRHLLFSGGVDSSLLAAALGGTQAIGLNLSLHDGDPEARHAKRMARSLGLGLESEQLHLTPGDLERAVGRYAAPTLDFSILPTHALGDIARSADATTLIDGTGGDAWFGFSSLANVAVWARIHHLHPVRHLAARAYGTLASLRDLQAWKPLKVVARAPRQPDAALAHLCASPLYDVVWSLPNATWEGAEAALKSTLDLLVGHRTHEPWRRMVIADAAFIATASFAAKSGQWSLVRHQETIYPFLTPGLTDVARRLPREMLIEGREAKPLIKRLAVCMGAKPADIYRAKAGFQPPLAALLRQNATRRYVELLFAEPSELDRWMSRFGRRLVEDVLQSTAPPTIHILYPLWNLLSLRIWLRELREGRAGRHWVD